MSSGHCSELGSERDSVPPLLPFVALPLSLISVTCVKSLVQLTCLLHCVAEAISVLSSYLVSSSMGLPPGRTARVSVPREASMFGGRKANSHTWGERAHDKVTKGLHRNKSGLLFY